MLLGLTTGAALAPARAAELEMDSLSFFLFETSQTVGRLPAGTIPITVNRLGPQTWTLNIAPASLSFPPVTYPSGRVVRWKLSSPATGALFLSGGKASCTITAPLMAYVDGSPTGIPFPLVFTTETAASSAGNTTAQRAGEQLDLSSGYLQLVAAGVSRQNAATAPGEPFYAVLSGRLVDLPADLLSAASAAPAP